MDTEISWILIIKYNLSFDKLKLFFIPQSTTANI